MNFTLEQLQKYKLVSCPFCNRDKKFIIKETANFYLTIDIFPLCNMHIMIASKEHFGCMGEVYKEFDAELQDLIQQTRLLLIKNDYADLTIYEHGRAGSCTVLANGNKCHHFHLHFVPIKTDFYGFFDEKYKYKALTNYSEIYDNCAKYGDYILYRSNKEIRFYYVEDKEVPPHLMRTLISNYINYPERANWEAYKDINIINNNCNNVLPLQALF